MFLLIVMWGISSLVAQDQQGLIYGKVSTIDEKEYLGMIRWGVEEAFWDDLFRSSKSEAEALNYLSPQVIKRLRDREEPQKVRWDFMSLWDNPFPNHKHAFRCRFGDIKSIEVTGESNALLSFKNGIELEVEGGNDIGSKVYVYDADGEQSRLDWARIQYIEFMPTPKDFLRRGVAALYGTVLTTQGAFKGYIQWDDEECLSTDRLEGKDANGKRHTFLFQEVSEISVEEESARVKLFTGREYLLGGTDDLSSRNHGIIVKHMELGRVHIPWTEFRFVKFEREVQGSGPPYDAFTLPKRLRATVETQDGQKYAGRFIFDLDEQLDLETIEGEADGVRYFIPLRNVASIERRNHKYCAVRLFNGDKLFLGEQHDVSDVNWGIIIWIDGADQAAYFPWPEIKMIDFE